MVIIIIILGGFGLNLTPCVLPMIPINLAIIGAGEKADNKWQGFMRGGAYGIGIAVAYGSLGLLAVLAGTRFGTLNSSPWFNLAIAVVFIVLALAMFDVFIIDFSKYSAKLGPKDSQKGKIVTAFLLGIVAALLAGACVAPVVIAVLLHSAQIYAAGNIAGLFLPFLLGIAMGLPWPFAGAGMAAIPKPGTWMVRIKQFFGVLIIFAALYYGYLAYTLLPIQAKGTNGERQQAKLTAALQQASKENKPVFIDFWATWCKNCTYMEATTFKDPKVIEALKKLVVVKFQAEDMKDAEIKPVLDYFKVQGLPSFAILTPRVPKDK
jgi:thiol:disulfide interchange protein